MTSLMTKISPKNICGPLKGLVSEQEPTKDLFILAGIAHDTFTGTTQYGNYIGFNGNFIAEKSDTKERFTAGKCFVPPQFENLLVAQLEKGEPSQFKILVGIKFSDNKIGYEFTCTPLIEQENPVAALLEN